MIILRSVVFFLLLFLKQVHVYFLDTSSLEKFLELLIRQTLAKLWHLTYHTHFTNFGMLVFFKIVRHIGKP